MTTTFFFLTPMIYLSGFIFPIDNMPEWIQPVTYLIPLRYFLVILRGIFLKGVGLETFWPQALALLGWGWRCSRSPRFARANGSGDKRSFGRGRLGSSSVNGRPAPQAPPAYAGRDCAATRFAFSSTIDSSERAGYKERR